MYYRLLAILRTAGQLLALLLGWFVLQIGLHFGLSASSAMWMTLLVFIPVYVFFQSPFNELGTHLLKQWYSRRSRARFYFVSRHAGAKQWAQNQALTVDEWLDHLDTRLIQPGDVVMGVLPVQMAADICQRGGRYLQLVIYTPSEKRGHEFNSEDLLEMDAKLIEFNVNELD